MGDLQVGVGDRSHCAVAGVVAGISDRTRESVKGFIVRDSSIDGRGIDQNWISESVGCFLEEVGSAATGQE
ncbi:hypothetical protein HanRHA438_Chr04g0191701 [Helianthus annuus]|nr:hypothetical protein HanIR_Chr04g0195811 [Helianthus annuus]KAJ0928227.1 hypothetical protein HanRHA438_Chr04g0191701 [Helianthus annuus]